MTKNRKTQQFLKNNISGETFYEKWPILSRSNVICNLKFAIDSNKLHVLLIMLYFLLIPSFLYHCVTTFYHTWHHKRLSVNLILNLKSGGEALQYNTYSHLAKLHVACTFEICSLFENGRPLKRESLLFDWMVEEETMYNFVCS